MAKPRIFVSSTYYDLKHVRSSLELFIESLGFEPILFEKGDIAFLPDAALDESCYREASSADLFVLIIGGRYGTAASNNSTNVDKSFFDRYDSITRKEFEIAHKSEIPTFILIDSGVYSEYYTFLKNRNNDTVVYAHVDSVNVFRLIEDILSKPKNNPVFGFERSSQIESWLRDQWAGLFREMLKNRSQQGQLSELNDQVGELKQINNTLKTYLEAIVKDTVSNSSTLIETEEKRLEEAKKNELLRKNAWYGYLKRSDGITEDDALKSISSPTSKAALIKHLFSMDFSDENRKSSAIRYAEGVKGAQEDINEARQVLGLDPLDFEPTSPTDSEEKVDRSRRQPKKSTSKSS